MLLLQSRERDALRKVFQTGPSGQIKVQFSNSFICSLGSADSTQPETVLAKGGGGEQTDCDRRRGGLLISKM